MRLHSGPLLCSFFMFLLLFLALPGAWEFMSWGDAVDYWRSASSSNGCDQGSY